MRFYIPTEHPKSVQWRSLLAGTNTFNRCPLPTFEILEFLLHSKYIWRHPQSVI